ncbi:ganglioside-induced differentiation-associated protein 1-like [Ptychodera flava]|uniref:ganglioside-induced differentiation-associated protein 1-like n=1 Tax=Ptychodera flava TaxID=63121 RepID=UPI003969D2D6
MSGPEKITLYHDHISYYSQRASLALAEKGIDYDSKIVPIANLAFVDPWFVKLNPAGKIPIIVHGDRVVAETPRILEYLDQAFPNTNRLHPDDSDVRKRVIYFRDLADSITSNDMMAGCVRYPHLVTESPNFPPGRMEKIIKVGNEDVPNKAAMLAKEHPELRTVYEQLIENRKKNRWDSPSEGDFKDTLSRADRLMSEVEDELKKTKHRYPDGESYRCGKDVSAADIFLIILMHRMKQYGMAKLFWTNGQRPNVSAYYEWMLSRETCAKVLPTFDFQPSK